MAALDHLAQLAQEASLETLASLDPRDLLLVDMNPDVKNSIINTLLKTVLFLRESLVSLERRDLLAPLD